METLKINSQGNQVKKLQELLNKLGASLQVDGKFGDGTEKAVKKFQKDQGLEVDGKVGNNTWGALTEAASVKEQTEPSIGVVDAAFWLKQKTWDKHSDNRLANTHPRAKAKFIELIVKAEQELGKKLRVTSGLRTIAEQNELYAQGRTKTGKIVTNAKGGSSYHNFGLAIDVVEIQGAEALWKNPDWKKIGSFGKKLGLEWGGDWISIKDNPHFQMSFGKSTKELLALYNAGKRDGEYVFLD